MLSIFPNSLLSLELYDSLLSLISSGPRYTVYTALATQDGENDPEITVLQNTTGQTLVWERTGEGEITATMTGSLSKAYCSVTNNVQAEFMQINFDATDDDIEDVYIMTVTDGILINTPFEIRIYP